MRADFKLYLPTKEEEESPSIYVNKKLVPLAQQLYEMANRCVSHGAPEDQSSIDMIPQSVSKQFCDINTYLETRRNKSCTFAVDEKQPTEKNGKLLKVLMKLIARTDNGKQAIVRLVRSSDNDFIKNSAVQIAGTDFKEYVTYLQFGHSDGTIRPGKFDYHLQSRYINQSATAIVKRFSLDLVYS